VSALVPSSVSELLGDTSGQIDKFVSNVQQTLQTVGSVYDQITGKADGVTPKPAAATATAPAEAPKPATMSTQTKYVLIGLCVVVLVLAIGFRR